MSDDDELHTYRVTATKTITAVFEVDGEDEDDAREQIENPPHLSCYVTVSDALNVSEDEWDVTEIEERS